MSIRMKSWVPGDLLASSDVNSMAENGVVQVDTVAELSTLFSVWTNVNVAFCLEDMTMYVRGETEFEVGTAGGYSELTWTTAPTTTEWTGVVGDRDEETYECYKWVAASQITPTKSGFVDVLCVGGGGWSFGSTGQYGTAGGAGGITFQENMWLEEGKTYPLVVGVPDRQSDKYPSNSMIGNSYINGLHGVAGATGSGYGDRTNGGGACGSVSSGGTAANQPSGGMRGQGFVGGDGTTLTRGGERFSSALPSGGAGPNGDNGGGWTSLPSWGQSGAVFSIGQGASGHNTTAGTGNANATGCVIIRTKKPSGGGVRSNVGTGLNTLGVAVVDTNNIVREKITIPDDKATEAEIIEHANSIPLVWNKRADDRLVVATLNDFGIGWTYHEDIGILGHDPEIPSHPKFNWDESIRQWVAP